MNKTTFIPQDDKKSVVIKREFDAPVKNVWKAWTTQELLEQWWAPAPWRAVTKEFDFSEGGRWLYAMVGPAPENQKHWSLEEYKEINPEQSFTADDYFCDENGTPLKDMPSNNWQVEFADESGTTKLKVTVKMKSEEDLQKLTEMGFKEGFSQGLDQLEALLPTIK